MKGVYFQMCNRSQSPSWDVYVLHMSEVSTKDTRYSRIVNLSFGLTSIEYQEAYCSRKLISQGRNLSYSVSAKKPISSSPSSDWLILLCLPQLDWQAQRHCSVSLCQWHRTLVPCVKTWRDDFLSSLQAHCTSDNLCWPHHVAWRAWKYLSIVFATLCFLKKSCKNLPMRTSVDLSLQLTSLCFWIFCFINCSGTLAYRARFRTWIKNKGQLCPKIFGYMSVLRCYGFWSQLGVFGIYPIRGKLQAKADASQKSCSPCMAKDPIHFTRQLYISSFIAKSNNSFEALFMSLFIYLCNKFTNSLSKQIL